MRITNNITFKVHKQTQPVQNGSSKATSETINDNNKILNSLNSYAAQNIAHIKLTSFKGKTDEESFEEFNKARIKAGIYSIEDLKKNIRATNILGAGANSIVYSFNDKELSKWAIKVDKHPFYKPTQTLFEKSDDEFYGVNMGQEIAKAGDRYRILKKIDGKVHSLTNWSHKINSNIPISEAEALQFASSLYEIANFPQSTFDDYAQQLKLLGEKGYKQDSINPNNILIDSKKQKLHIIDSFRAVNETHVNSRIDLINVLLDFSFFDKFYEKLDKTGKEMLLKSAETIIEKCNIASSKNEIPQDEETYLKYLTEVDKWFGFYLVDKGGDYRTRYERMKKLLPNINE